MIDGKSDRAAVWVCRGAMICVAIGVNLPPVYFTTFKEAFGGPAGLTVEQIGRIPAAMFAALVLGIVVSGPLADRWGARLFAAFGLALTVAGLVAVALSPSYPMLLAAACLMGFGVGVLDMILSPITCALCPTRRASAMNWLHSFFCTGAVATVLFGSLMLWTHVPWRAVFAAAAAFPALILLGVLRMKAPPLVAEGTSRDPVLRLLGMGLFWAALAVIMLGGAAEQGMAQWLPTYAEESLGIRRSFAGLTLAAFLSVMAVGRMSAAVLTERIRPVHLMVGAGAATVLFYMIGCFSASVPLAAAGCIAVGLTSSCFWPTTLGIAANRFPSGGASMFAMLSAFGNAGCFVMAWVVGLVASGTQLNIGLSTAAVCPAAMVGILLWMNGRHAPVATGRTAGN